jgi:hypothetical protein
MMMSTHYLHLSNAFERVQAAAQLLRTKNMQPIRIILRLSCRA